MDIIDSLFLQEDTAEAVPCKSQYSKAFVNYRDKKGRTALHMAVGLNNKTCVEALLYLGANPHIPDVYGQRPVDICYVESIKTLLDAKMAQTSVLTPIDPAEWKAGPKQMNDTSRVSD